jgi:hypothetical protein
MAWANDVAGVRGNSELVIHRYECRSTKDRRILESFGEVCARNAAIDNDFARVILGFRIADTQLILSGKTNKA